MTVEQELAEVRATLQVLRRISRIGQDLTSLQDRRQLLERAASCLIEDLSHKGATVITRTRGMRSTGAAKKFVRAPNQTPVFIPIQFDGEVLGTIVIPRTIGCPLTDAEREILDIFAQFLGIGLNNVRRMEEVRDLAFVDPLTGVLNRRHFLEVLPQKLAGTKSTAIITFDIDRFKRINDTYGHLAGDAVLRFVADRAYHCIRKTDSIARCGGDEFVILLPNARMESARDIAERIRKNVEKSAVAFEGRQVQCTISVGVACCVGDVDLPGLMIHADQALYAAKHSGRNLVCSD